MLRPFTLLLVPCLMVNAQTPSPSPAPIVFTHMADASAAEWLGEGLIAVANDEDNALRVFKTDGGAPVASWDAAPWLNLDKKSPEMDLEGSAKIAGTIYWTASHAPNKDGKPRPNRHRLFATRVSVTNGVPCFQLVGAPLTTLVGDLDRDPRYAPFKLKAAALLPPKTPHSLNIEALCDTPEGGLLIGFRSPNPQGKALLARLDNPAEVMAGQPPRLGDPTLLDLGGNGIRAMLRAGGVYLIMSGSPVSGGAPRLYTWDGRAQPQPKNLSGLPADTNPEALALVEQDGSPTLLVISDDGTRLVDGVPAKTLADPARRTFRGFRLPLVTSVAPAKMAP